jgi:hypothetical protein
MAVMKRKRRTVRKKPERQRRHRLLIEAKKLNPNEERALAEEGMTGEEASPLREDLLGSALAACGKHTDPEGASRIAEEHDRHLAQAYRLAVGSRDD